MLQNPEDRRKLNMQAAFFWLLGPLGDERMGLARRMGQSSLLKQHRLLLGPLSAVHPRPARPRHNTPQNPKPMPLQLDSVDKLDGVQTRSCTLHREREKKNTSEYRADKYAFTASKEEAEVASKRTIKPVHAEKHRR